MVETVAKKGRLKNNPKTLQLYENVSDERRRREMGGKITRIEYENACLSQGEGGIHQTISSFFRGPLCKCNVNAPRLISRAVCSNEILYVVTLQNFFTVYLQVIL